MYSVRSAADRVGLRVEHLLVLDGPDPEAFKSIAAVSSSALVDVHVIAKQHSGIADSRNAGLAIARSRIVTLLDADDELTSERMAVACDGLPQRVAVIGTQTIVGPHGDAVPGIWPPRMAEDRPLHYLTSIVLPTAWARALGGFDMEFTVGDDWDFVVRLREARYPIEFRDEVFAIRHIDGSNASSDTRGLAGDFLHGLRMHRRRIGAERTRR